MVRSPKLPKKLKKRILEIGSFTFMSKQISTNIEESSEIIYTNANASKSFMGLKTWKNAPHGKILKNDAIVAKNYVNAPRL